jgi:hypothetical protein
MDFLEPMGNRWWPIFGAVFLVSAIKRHQGMRLIGQISPIRVPVVPNLSPAAERNQLNLGQDEVN